jgi:putative transposase
MKKFAPQEIRTFFVTSVTWGRRSLFQTDRMADLFFDVIRNSRKDYLLHEFVLMPNHFHLLVTPQPNISLERAVQRIKGGFSFRAKRELKFNGEVWQAGFSEHRVVGCDDYQSHRDYIVRNPERAGLPRDYPHVSGKNGAFLDPPPPGLKPPSKTD